MIKDDKTIKLLRENIDLSLKLIRAKNIMKEYQRALKSKCEKEK